MIHHLFRLLKFKNAIFKILCSTAQHAGIAVHNHPPGGRHIWTEIWQRLSSLFPFSRAFSAFPFFPPFPLFRGFLKNKSLCGGESIRSASSLMLFVHWCLSTPLTYTYLDCLLGVKMRGHKMAEI